MTYHDKYLKYKSKYIQLQKQLGGSNRFLTINNKILSLYNSVNKYLMDASHPTMIAIYKFTSDLLILIVDTNKDDPAKILAIKEMTTTFTTATSYDKNKTNMEQIYTFVAVQKPTLEILKNTKKIIQECTDLK